MDVGKNFETTIKELERILNSRSVVGDAIKVDGATVIPLVSIGLGFGVGEGEPGTKEGGHGAGMGGGGGVKPVAVLVHDKEGMRVESIRAAASVIGKIAESVTEIAQGRISKPQLKKPES